MRFIEVSHRVVPGMKTYPGLPEPTVDVIVDYESSRDRYGGKAEFPIASLHLCGNTGTYVDSPRHRYPTGGDLADLPLERSRTCLGGATFPVRAYLIAEDVPKGV